MERASKLAVALIGMLLVTACQDTPTELVDPQLDEIDLPTHATHDGDEPEQDDEAVDPSTYRVVFTFTAENGLLPKQSVSLLIEGVAVEPVTGGEVFITLPTKAAMDHAGSDDAPYFPAGMKLPVVGRWRLPAMAAGEQWKQRITVPAMEKGYYHVALSGFTFGPPSDLGPFLVDDVYQQVWMFISDRGATLTDMFDEAVFPEGTRRVAGPILARDIGGGAGDAAYSAPPDTARRRYVYTSVTYYTGSEYEPAVGATITGAYVHRRSGSSHGRTTQMVPESGIVRWTCPGSNVNLEGSSRVPATRYVREGEWKLNDFWDVERSECGDTIQVPGKRYVYMPWHHLNESAALIQDHFDYDRGKVKWRVRVAERSSSYSSFWDRITFNHAGVGSRWTAAHEYGHAIHAKALGGMWSTDNCREHSVFRVSSYTCAFSEGFADYAGDIGAPDDTYLADGWENFSTWDTGTKGKIEGYVAALFHDLIDDENETDDETSYSANYVATVFKSCYVRAPFGRSRHRNDVSDFVWCLENRVDADVHDAHFPGITAPGSVSERATEPSDWNADDIRLTWLLNLEG